MGESTATASSRMRKVPIVIVPGTMGTRLTESNGDLVWNPTFDRGIFAANDGRLKDLSKPLFPDEQNGFPVHDDRFMQVLEIRHINNIIFDFYGALAIAMKIDLRARLAKKNVFPVVSCCGYDFRVDNAKSAERLRSVVDEARVDCDGETAIIIAHSMGGLITRHYCKNLGGEAKVRAVFLLASPTHGAPDAYLTLRTGLADLFPLRLVMMQRRETSRRFSRMIPSVYQLLPGILYGRIDPKWLMFDGTKTGYSPDMPIKQSHPQFTDASENFFLYEDIYTGLTDDLEFRKLSSDLTLQARVFDAGLLVGSGDATYMHPKTFIAAGTGVDTKVRAKVSFDVVRPATLNDVVVESTVEDLSGDGDKTVPLISANPSRVQPEAVESKLFPGVEHQKVPATRSVIDYVIARIHDLF